MSRSDRSSETSLQVRESRRGDIRVGLVIVAMLALGAWLDIRTGWIDPVFDGIAHLFYEIPTVAAVRRESQLTLVRWLLPIGMGLFAGGLLLSPRLGSESRWWWRILCLGYLIRAAVWIVGGNLPLIPGDSSHYVEVATSIARGSGPVKHYVESFFIDYTPHMDERGGILDDWATPLYSYILAGLYLVLGIGPDAAVETRFAAAKGLSFVCNLLCLPALHGFTRRVHGPVAANLAMALLAVLPVHAIYAGFALRESLVALTAILAVWGLSAMTRRSGARGLILALVAGCLGGLSILARNTSMVLVGAAALWFLLSNGRRAIGPLIAWSLALVATIAPWAFLTYREYGEPFYTYTKYFEFNFSWTVHHYEMGNTRADQFYTAANATEIVRVKLKALAIILVTSTMILSLPVVLACMKRLRRGTPESPGRSTDRLVAFVLISFIAATLAKIADVTQVAQLGRYYMPVFVLLLPTAAAGFLEVLGPTLVSRLRIAFAASLIALLWSDPTWAYDAGWYVKPFQLHWPAIAQAGEFVRAHPEQVPETARVMTWFPWEFRVVSDRMTVLMPRSYYPPHILAAMDRYQVSHVLWGSFEPPSHVDPESWGPYLSSLRDQLGLSERRLIYESPRGTTYPVRLYDLRRPR